MPTPTKQERTDEFLRRLDGSAPCATLAEAYDLLCDTLNAVEDQYTTTPFNPANWQTDGRMYPPQEDQKRIESEEPLVLRYRSKRHSNWIGQNGSIRITNGGATCLDKPGRDGLTIQDLMDIAQPRSSSGP